MQRCLPEDSSQASYLVTITHRIIIIITTFLFCFCNALRLSFKTPLPPPPPTPSPHVHTQHTATGGGYAVTPGYQAVNTKGFDSPPAYAPNPSAPSPNGQPAPQYPGNQVPPYYYPQAPRGPPQQVNDCYI